MHNEIKKPPLTRWFSLWQMQQAAFKAAPRLAATNVAAKRLAQRENRRRAASGRKSKAVFRMCPDWRAQM